MKKTILAALITAATSTSVMAETDHVPTNPGYSTEVKVDAFNAAMERLGGNHLITETTDAVTGETTYYYVAAGATPVKLGEHNQDAFIAALEKAAEENHYVGTNPIEPGFGVDPLPGQPTDGINPVPVPGERIEFSNDVKADAFNKAMAKNGSTVQISKSLENGTFYLIQEGADPIALDEHNEKQFKQAVKKAWRDSQNVGVSPIDPGFGVDPIEDFIPDYGDPVAPIEDAPILIGDGKHEERKEARETAREERQAERKDKGGVIVRPIDELPQPTPEEPINPEKPMPIHDGENPFDGSKAEAAREALDTSREDAREEGKTVTDELQERVEEIKSTYKGDIAQQAAAQTQSQIDELYALGNQNSSDIETLFNEVDRLDSRIDQTQALNAATVNARPMVTNGMTAFGAGVGYAGSEAALAIGVAHSFEDTGWSASGTLAASSDDVVIGAGTQYAF